MLRKRNDSFRVCASGGFKTRRGRGPGYPPKRSRKSSYFHRQIYHNPLYTSNIPPRSAQKKNFTRTITKSSYEIRIHTNQSSNTENLFTMQIWKSKNQHKPNRTKTKDFRQQNCKLLQQTEIENGKQGEFSGQRGGEN